MAVPFENITQSTPVENLAFAIEQRHAELTALSLTFTSAMEVLYNMSDVNMMLAASDRPDLVVTEPVNVMRVDTLSDMRRINNFYPNMGGFGMRVFGPAEKLPSGRVIRPALGRRQPTEEELGRYFLMGARGNYDEHLAFAEQNGVERDEAIDMLLASHIAKESFMRMWILFPQLTRTLMERCLTEDRSSAKHINEEVFVAYNLMARLVDKGDKDALRDGEVDEWALCH